MHHQTKNLVFGESVAQQVEHNTFNVGVPGSSPGGFTSFFMLSGRVITLLLCFFIIPYEQARRITKKQSIPATAKAVRAPADSPVFFMLSGRVITLLLCFFLWWQTKNSI